VRVETLLRILVWVLVIGVLIIAGALLRFVFQGGKAQTPRTELERAVVAAEEAVNGNPNDATARVKLAAAYLEEGSAKAALQQAQYAVRLEPAKPEPYYILGLAQLANNDYKGAVASLTKAANTQGQTADFYGDVYVQLSRAQEKAGDSKSAVDTLGRAIGNEPENAILMVGRAQLYERLKQWYLAASDYYWALHYSPDYQPAVAGLNALTKAHPAEVAKAKAQFAKDSKDDQLPGVTPIATATP
jgi:Flp pilus assembly protein TadD